MADLRDHRQLLAIMFTDVVGYTALTERDEAAAVRVRTQHRDLVRTLVEQFEGELIDSTGDESLSIFPSALRAVDCALALQGALRSYPDMRLRIGIHLGDVIRRNGEVVGEGVNVAARIRPLAQPGGICVSEPVYQMVRSRAHVKALALGAQSFKNVSTPLAVYALAVADSEAALPRPRRRRLLWAVLTAVLLLAGVVALNRGALLAWVALTAPRYFAHPIEQTIAFAHTSDGVRIAYATTGQGPAIVNVLGWATHIEGGFNSPLYDAAGLLPMSSAHHLFVRYDGRGFGLSDRDVKDFSLEARVRDLEAVIDALHVDRVGMYAMSAGGPTAIAYVARHPERVSRLVLASTAVGIRGNLSEGFARIVRAIPLFETDWQTPAVTNIMVDWLSPNADDVQRRVLGEFLRRSGSGAAVAGFFRAINEIDVSEQARQIAVPTMVIHAREDHPVPVEAGRALAALIPNVRFEIVEGGHIQGTGGTPEVRARIIKFFDEDSGAPAPSARLAEDRDAPLHCPEHECSG
jgi:class 3 adenylate cyclase/pimeloyl-ACP methyl ester carboxylesterase